MRTKSQIGKMSRRKGKQFERWCAGHFTKFTGLLWQTTRNSGRTDLKGDIYCVDYPDLPVVIECKNDKRYTAHAMLKPTKEFWDMVHCTRSKIGNKILIIILKNETGIWILSEPDIFNYIIHYDMISTAYCGRWVKIEDIKDGEIWALEPRILYRKNKLNDTGRLRKTSKGRKKQR